MIPFVIIAALMLVIACAWVLLPLLSRSADEAVEREAANLDVLRDQRREIESDLASGLLSPQQYEAARADLERRVLDEAGDEAPSEEHRARPGTGTIALIAAGLPIAAIALYALLGTPVALLPVTAQTEPNAQSAVSPAEIDTMIGRVKERLAQKPDDLEGWLVLARTLYSLGRMRESVEAYERAAAIAPDNADILADYADAVGITQGRSLDGLPEQLIERALRANPDQWKANALAGTIAFKRGDAAKAIVHWESVQRAVPPDSPVAKTIAATLAEARSRAGLATASKPEPPPRSNATTVAGTVTLDPALAASVTPDDTVFVFARPADGSRMPLALLRVKAKDLPLAFKLDDSLAMLPNRKLSDHGEVVVGARVSKSGKAMPQPGDLEGATPTVRLGTTNVALTIDRKIR
ncbi:MAG TPA: c-type cytochrome biogenesis protein CcmI [Casimicrobiaceae bacterium]|nr:c-type cytochrome biogenesis protein CcmI [Casimicrobiaceae bacterium]